MLLSMGLISLFKPEHYHIFGVKEKMILGKSKLENRI
jgi:hypothetical protein